MINQQYVKLINSSDTHPDSVLELNILPGQKTPWHYHSLFSETFHIIKGELEVGKGTAIHHLKQGDTATIVPNEKHYYHNVSTGDCIIQVTVSPGNKNFEQAIFILKGLSKDGLADAAGTPKKFPDLALFVYLSNSKMVGLQKIAAPIFNWVAKNAIQNGRLNELRQQYGQPTSGI